MYKTKKQTEKRGEFIRTVMNDREQAANILEQYAEKLRTTKSTVDRVSIISDLLCISECTIYRDISNL